MNIQGSGERPKRMAPWQDRRGNTLREGDIVRDTRGHLAKVEYIEGDQEPWKLRYNDQVVAVRMRDYVWHGCVDLFLQVVPQS